MGGKGGGTTVTSNQPPQEVLNAYKSLIDRGTNVSQTPYQAYTGQMVAPLTQTQQSAIQGITNSQGIAQPYYDQAQGLAASSANPIYQNLPQFSAENIQQYQNPYVQNVVDATRANLNQNNAIQQNQLLGKAISSGASPFGGDRAGVAAAELARGQNLSDNQTISGLYSDAYNNAVGQFNNQQNLQANVQSSDAARQQQAASLMGGLGQSAQSGALQGYGAQLQGGTVEQQQAQNALNAQYQQYQQQQAYPFETTNFLAGLVGNLGGASGGTSTSTAPAPSLTSQLGGLGMFGLGLGALFKNGGRIPYADGGAIPDYSKSFVPDVKITSHGFTMPTAVPAQKEPEIDPSMFISALAGTKGLGSLKDKMFGSDYGLTGGSAPVDYSQMNPTNPFNSAFRNGGVVGYEDGGEVDEDNDNNIIDNDLTSSLQDAGIMAAPVAISSNPPPADTKNGLLGISDDAKYALMAAGLATAAGTSPNAIANIGKGGLAGLQTYTARQAAERKAQLEQQKQAILAKRADALMQHYQNRDKTFADSINATRTGGATGALIKQYMDSTGADFPTAFNYVKNRQNDNPLPPTSSPATSTIPTPTTNPAPVVTNPPKTPNSDLLPDNLKLPDGTPSPQAIIDGTNTTNDVKNYAKGLVEGRYPFPTGMIQKSNPVARAALQLAMNADPQYDTATSRGRSNTYNKFVAGKSGDELQALNTSLGHYRNLMDAWKNLDNFSLTPMNDVKNYFAGKTGKGQISAFNQAKTLLAPELMKAYGAGHSVTETEQFKKNFNEDASPEQQKAVLDMGAQLMRSKIQALQDSYERGMKTVAGFDKISKIGPDGLQTLKDLGVDLSDLHLPKYDKNTAPQQAEPPAKLPETPTIKTQEEFDKLPSGSIYMEENGKKFRKQ